MTSIGAVFVVVASLTTSTSGVPSSAPNDQGWLPFAPAEQVMLDRAVGDALVGSTIDGVGGVALGILHRGRVYRQARGFIDRHRRRSTTTTTPFRLASITKTMTAVVALQMIEEGRLSFDDAVGRFLPGTPETWGRITVRQLLTHTSGIPHYPPGTARLLDVHLTTNETLRLIARRPVVAAPGERFIYSSDGYGVLGAMLERIEGSSLDSILEARVFDPLGMASTFVEDSRHRRADWPAGWRITDDGAAVPSVRIDLSSRRAGGGVRGTIDDLLVFADGLLRHDLVSAATFGQMTTATELPDGTLVDYGLGVAVYPRHGHRVVAHAGGQPETTSLLLLVPDEDIVVVAATNVEGQDQVLSRIADAALAVLLGGGVVHRDVVARDPGDDAVVFVVRRAVSWGLADLDDTRVHAPPEALDDAFVRFSAFLDDGRLRTKSEAIKLEARELHHPRAHRVTPLVGRVVAQTVRETDGAAFDDTVRRGPLRLMARYIEICDADPRRCPVPRRLSPAVSTRVTHLDRAYRTVASPEVRSWRCIDVSGDGGVEEALALLQPLVGADAHPDVADDLRRAVEQLVPDRLADARRLADLNVALHPRAPRALLSLAEVLLLTDRKSAPDEALRVLEDLARHPEVTSLSPRLWRQREGWLRTVRTPRANVAADVLHAFAKGQLHAVAGDDDH